MATESSRVQIIFPTHLKEAAKRAAAEKGINFSEFVKDAVKLAVAGSPNNVSAK